MFRLPRLKRPQPIPRPALLPALTPFGQLTKDVGGAAIFIWCAEHRFRLITLLSSNGPVARRAEQQDSAVVDTNGLPVQLALTAGEAHDNRLASKLLSRLKSGTMLLADRGMTPTGSEPLLPRGRLGQHPTKV